MRIVVKVLSVLLVVCLLAAGAWLITDKTGGSGSGVDNGPAEVSGTGINTRKIDFEMTVLEGLTKYGCLTTPSHSRDVLVYSDAMSDVYDIERRTYCTNTYDGSTVVIKVDSYMPVVRDGYVFFFECEDSDMYSKLHRLEFESGTDTVIYETDDEHLSLGMLSQKANKLAWYEDVKEGTEGVLSGEIAAELVILDLGTLETKRYECLIQSPWSVPFLSDEGYVLVRSGSEDSGYEAVAYSYDGHELFTAQSGDIFTSASCSAGYMAAATRKNGICVYRISDGEKVYVNKLNQDTAYGSLDIFSDLMTYSIGSNVYIQDLYTGKQVFSSLENGGKDETGKKLYIYVGDVYVDSTDNTVVLRRKKIEDKTEEIVLLRLNIGEKE